jgi:hypothetical protein
MKPIVFHDDAAQEAHEARDYYDGVRAGLGDDFQAELNAALARIALNPHLYAAESGAIRLCPLDRFPYSLYYEELVDQIWIAAVAHHSRRPGYWSSRSPN